MRSLNIERLIMRTSDSFICSNMGVECMNQKRMFMTKTMSTLLLVPKNVNEVSVSINLLMRKLEKLSSYET